MFHYDLMLFLYYKLCPQHLLYLTRRAQGQGSFRPVFGAKRLRGASGAQQRCLVQQVSAPSDNLLAVVFSVSCVKDMVSRYNYSGIFDE